jgi:8-oxo-dGTP pyrophosphatase MutT (NUDIX family)
MIHPFDDAYRRQVASRCAAFSRLTASDTTPGLRRAAVAITLLETEDASGATAFLLTRRAAGLHAHGGQWALPGGGCDERETIVEAALRELDEEIGVRLGADQVLGMLDDYPTRSGYLITPVVLWAGNDPQLRPNPEEVASVHRIPLTEIAREDAVDLVAIPESNRRLIRIHIHRNFIYAPTAAMIYQFREVLAGRDTRVAELEQPVFAWR